MSSLPACLAVAACALVAGLGWAPRALADADTGAVAGRVLAHAPGDGAADVPVAGVTVTATGPSQVSSTATTGADGEYAFDELPAPASYTVTFAVGGASDRGATQTVPVAAGGLASADTTLTVPVAVVSGRVSAGGHALPGMPIGLEPVPTGACDAGAICGPATTTGHYGRWRLAVATGSYDLAVVDAGRTIISRSIDATAGQVTPASLRLGPAPVLAGTGARHATRDLRWLNAERTRAGLPAGVVLNPRWSDECAAHDAYEAVNGVLTHSENLQAPGASVGGAWAGLASVLARGRWTAAADPWWQSAPIHLMQLLSPSLSVIGLDDSGSLQCATTYPGLVRAPVAADAVSTYPGDGARGVPTRELAREQPFVPAQFVGLPAGHTTGRELFVYLNQAGRAGQAPVTVLAAGLARGSHPVAVRWVDNTTPTVGQYLTGAIVIPVAPLRPHTQYTASVTVRDRSSTITRRWSFTTAAH